MVARQKRYQAFLEELDKDGILALAHHASDQVETIFLNMLRGGGLHGIAAMSPFADYQSIKLWRPLLSVAKRKIYECAKSNNLQWVEDESNQNVKHKRNQIRQQLLPALDRIETNSINHIIKSIQQVKSDLDTLEYFSQDFWNREKIKSKGLALASFQPTAWQVGEATIEKNLIKQLLRQYGISLIRTQLENLWQQWQKNRALECCLLDQRQRQILIYKCATHLSLYDYQACLTQLSLVADTQKNWQTREVGDYLIIDGKKRRIKSWLKQQRVPKAFRNKILLLKNKQQVLKINYPLGD